MRANITVVEGRQHSSLLMSVPDEFSVSTLELRVSRALELVDGVSRRGVFADGCLVDHGHYRFTEAHSKTVSDCETREHHRVENTTA